MAWGPLVQLLVAAQVLGWSFDYVCVCLLIWLGVLWGSDAGEVESFCLVFRELAWSLGSRMLAWPLITLKATARGVDWDMVMRTWGEVRVMLHRHRWDGGQSYLVFRILAWPLEKKETSTRSMHWNVVTRRRGAMGLCWAGTGGVKRWSYLGFRILTRSLAERKASARDVTSQSLNWRLETLDI